MRKLRGRVFSPGGIKIYILKVRLYIVACREREREGERERGREGEGEREKEREEEES
jgi:hypothetical protein